MKSSTVQFSIEEMEYPNAEGQMVKYGPDFAGSFVCRSPSLDEARVTLPFRIAARAQRDGVADVNGAWMNPTLFAAARIWLDSLSQSVPGWYEAVQNGDADDDDTLFMAVMASYNKLMEALAEKKKARAAHSVTPLPNTLPRAAMS